MRKNLYPVSAYEFCCRCHCIHFAPTDGLCHPDVLSVSLTLVIIFRWQPKERQKKKRLKGIRVDADGDVSLEDLTNSVPVEDDLEKESAHNRKVSFGYHDFNIL